MSRTQTFTTGGVGTIHNVLFGKKKGDVAYHAVRRTILLGHIQPGDALLEQKIADGMNCSQGTVREALMRLEQDGLVSRLGYRGTVVSSPSLVESAEMVKIRVQLECLGIRQAKMPLRSSVIAQLWALTEEMDKATAQRDYYRCSELDRDFHMTIFRQAELPALESILNRSALHIHRFTFMNADEVVPDDDFGEVHRGLVRILQNNDTTAAEVTIKAHIERVLERFAPRLGRAAIQPASA